MFRDLQIGFDKLIGIVRNATQSFGFLDLNISGKPEQNSVTDSLVVTELKDISEVFDSMISVEPYILLRIISTIGRICGNIDIIHHIRNMLKLQISEDPDEVLCPGIALKRCLSVFNGRIAKHFSIINAE